MKKWYTTAACGLALALSLSAYAVPIPITNNGDGTDDNFQNITGGTAIDSSITGWLEGEILSYNNHVPGANLPDPTLTITKFENLDGNSRTIDVAANDYVVIHYGAGKGGEPGGGLVALFFPDAESFTPDANGSGPNGFGGISFVWVFDHGNNVPDSATTAMLLGGALAVLGVVRRKLNV
jgi:hypothetical protein